MKTALAFAIFALFLAFMVACEVWGRITGKPGQALSDNDED